MLGSRARSLLVALALLGVVPAVPALAQSSQPDRRSEADHGLFLALDRLLGRVEAGYRPDSIADRLEPRARVTVESRTTGMNVDAAAEILEVLPNDRYRVRTEGVEKVLTGPELRRLNLPYVIPDGAGVMAGGSRWSGPIATIDRAHDPHLRAFLDRARAVGAEPITDMEKLKRLTDLVNESLKYPGHEVPDKTKYDAIDSRYSGKPVPFGAYLEAGQGVCRHKALAMKLALEAVGIQSRYVVGEALNRTTREVRGGHAWIEALTADGKRLLVDPTWHDPGIPLEDAYKSSELRRPKPDARRILPPGERPIERRAPVDGPDLFEGLRRADGTVEWRRVPGDFLRSQAAGMAHFAFALFLKELPPVLLSGDPARLEEFVDALASVDFFVTYGLFSVGARAGELAYERTALHRMARSRFMDGMLKTQVALAAGVLLPELVRSRGRLDGKAYLVDVASLGLSVAAVKGAVEGLKGVFRLSPVKLTWAARRAPVVGWVYSAAELAVILSVGEGIQAWANRLLDERSARLAVRRAADALLRLPPDASSDQVREKLAALAAANEAWRTHLYRPVEEAEARAVRSAGRHIREAVGAGSSESAASAALRANPALAAYVEGRHGSVDSYLDGRSAEARAELAARAEELSETQREAMRDLYVSGRREGAYLPGDEEARWVLGGARDGAEGDPARGFWFIPGLLRDRARDRVLDRITSLSKNRLQTYEDEDRLLAALASARPAWRDEVAARREELGAVERLEREVILPFVDSRGMVEALGGGRR